MIKTIKKQIVTKPSKEDKTINNSIPKLERANTESRLVSLKYLVQWRERKPTEALIERIIDDLERWVALDESTDIYEFIHSMGMASATYYNWVDKYEKLELANGHVVEMLGVRRAKHAEYKKYGANDSTILRTLHNYHPMYRKSYEEDKERDANKPNEPVTIRIEKI